MKRPIGIFDSGLGGLSVAAEIKKLFNGRKYIYFGDTARIPYGTKSVEVIKRFALQDCRFLLSKSVSAIIVACGTVSANAIDDLKDNFDVPIIGVVEPTVKKAVDIARGGFGRVAVLGTAATIKSGAYERNIALLDRDIEVFSKACPLFVPLVENGYLRGEIASLIAREYLDGLARKKPDAVILGCTHYPLLSDTIAEIFEGSVLVNSGAEAAGAAAALIGAEDIAEGEAEYYVSDDALGFSLGAKGFLGEDISKNVSRVNIEEF